jgi:hypothetical protein
LTLFLKCNGFSIINGSQLGKVLWLLSVGVFKGLDDSYGSNYDYNHFSSFFDFTDWEEHKKTIAIIEE